MCSASLRSNLAATRSGRFLIIAFEPLTTPNGLTNPSVIPPPKSSWRALCLPLRRTPFALDAQFGDVQFVERSLPNGQPSGKPPCLGAAPTILKVVSMCLPPKALKMAHYCLAIVIRV